MFRPRFVCGICWSHVFKRQFGFWEIVRELVKIFCKNPNKQIWPAWNIKHAITNKNTTHRDDPDEEEGVEDEDEEHGGLHLPCVDRLLLHEQTVVVILAIMVILVIFYDTQSKWNLSTQNLETQHDLTGISESSWIAYHATASTLSFMCLS